MNTSWPRGKPSLTVHAIDPVLMPTCPSSMSEAAGHVIGGTNCLCRHIHLASLGIRPGIEVTLYRSNMVGREGFGMLYLKKNGRLHFAPQKTSATKAAAAIESQMVAITLSPWVTHKLEITKLAQ